MTQISPYETARPHRTAEAAPYWEGLEARALKHQHCRKCAATFFPPRSMCPQCWSTDLEWRTSTGRGRVYSVSVQYFAPSPAWKSKLPYALGIVELDESYFMFAEIVAPDLEAIKTGDRVEVMFERVLDDLILPKFHVVA